ncbi:unnamed protein product [Caenorhabditis angaria]|uniref:Uncharacterized protein n=1 Tax=Caenorhabditis angaria TaxID=860376 RepID=A0A9P1N765_9PELO|nr:unnamed protein product [Caenorhabditis angaria]
MVANCELFGVPWANSWSIFVLGFTTGTLLLTCMYTIIFMCYRFSVTKSDEFKIRDEVALPPRIIGKHV